MSIGNFAQLKNTMAEYLHRTDLTSMLPDFITLAEAKLNRRLRLIAQESTDTGSVAASVALPDDFAELISLKVTVGANTYPVSYLPTGKTRGEDGGTYYYTTTGTNLEFEPVASGATYKLTYYAKFSALEDGVNWLITNAPDVYLYASLLEATPYLMDDARIGVWEHMLYGDPGDPMKKGALQQLEDADRNAKFGNNLRMVRG